MAEHLLLPYRVRLALVMMLSACADPAGGPPGETHVVSFDWPSRGVPQLDLLFAVDDSTTMAPYRDRVQSLATFGAAVLASYSAGKPDLHIGVTTHGELEMITDIHNRDGSRQTSYTGTLEAALAALVDVGSTSTTSSQPLAAIDQARTAGGFRREDANLMIVTISASDDSSLDSVAAYVDRAGEAIATGAYPMGAPRLDAFHTALGPGSRKVVESIDAADYRSVFEPLNIIVDYGATCLDATAPYDCAISMIEDGRETVLPSCEHSPTGPCWNIVDDPQNCPQQHTIDIRGYARIYRPHLVGQCVSQ